MAKQIKEIPLSERTHRRIFIDMTQATYDRLQSGERVRGSLVAAGPMGVEFTDYRPQKPPQKPDRVLRQPHGRVEIYADRVRVRLSVGRDEDVDPAETIDRESGEASRFVERNAWRAGFRPFGYEW